MSTSHLQKVRVGRNLSKLTGTWNTQKLAPNILESKWSWGPRLAHRGLALKYKTKGMSGLSGPEGQRRLRVGLFSLGLHWSFSLVPSTLPICSTNPTLTFKDVFMILFARHSRHKDKGFQPNRGHRQVNQKGSPVCYVLTVVCTEWWGQGLLGRMQTRHTGQVDSSISKFIVAGAQSTYGGGKAARAGTEVWRKA